MTTSSGPNSASTARSAVDVLALGQGAFFLVSGAWPLVHMRSFEAVTGPKADEWLVRTVGSLLGVVGGVLIAAGRRRRVTPELRALAMGSAGVLAAIDAVYVAKGRMSRIYLLDAAVELGIVAAWAMATKSRRLERSARERLRMPPMTEARHPSSVAS